MSSVAPHHLIGGVALAADDSQGGNKSMRNLIMTVISVVLAA
jgi:hypothetical protein